jgi:hypothetical protein
VALLEALSDDFSDPTASASKWTTVGNVTFTDGQAALNGGSPSTITMSSTAVYTLGQNANASYLLAKVASFAGASSFEMRVQDTTGSVAYTIVLGSNQLTFRRTTPAITNTSMGAYDGYNDAWWRIKVVGGTIYAGTSVDGITWPNEFNYSYPCAFVNENSIQAKFTVTSGAYGAGFYVDNVNLIPPYVTLNPNGVTDAETVTGPTGTQALTVNPGNVTDPETATGPTITQALQVLPTTVTDPEALGTLATTIAATVYPSSAADPETVGNPNISQPVPLAPGSILDPDTVGAPTIATPVTLAASPDNITDPEGFSPLTVTFVAAPKLASSIQDEFLGTALNPNVWRVDRSNTGDATVSGGNLNLTLTNSATSNVVQVATIDANYILSNDTFYIKINPNRKNNTTTELWVQNNTVGRYARFTLGGGSTNVIMYALNDAGGIALNTGQAWNAVNWNYWRFRMSGTSLYFDRSDNGTSWTQAAVANNITWGGSVLFYFSLSVTNQTNTPPHLTQIDAVNAAGGAMQIVPITLTDPETINNPTLTLTPSEITPNPIVDPEALNGPTVTASIDTTTYPDTITDPETLDAPTITQPLSVFPDETLDPETLDSPDVTQALDVYPDAILDPETLDDPAITTAGPMEVEPDSITDPETLGAGVKTAAIAYPDQILDPEELGQPDVVWIRETDNWNYGAGIYTHGPYYGYIVPVPGCIPNPTYGSGTYGCGVYYGYSIPTIGDPELFADVAAYGPPLHILGIGPWTPAIDWRGAPNYGVKPGPLPPAVTPPAIATLAADNETVTAIGSSRPVLALPPTTSKGFTLRLDGGSEARTDLQMRRGEAVIIDEMDTDLWWRRKDPRTKKLEVIGRFNSNNVELATSDTGVNLSAHWEDYATVLGNRLILEYLNPKALPDPTTMWPINTPVTQILAWALPKNTGLDLSEVTGPKPYPLGGISQAYHLPPGTLIADVFDNLEALSINDWEWWIETPNDVTAAPKLRFVIGKRGTDRGVTLVDAGSGPTPIASWTRAGATDNYANTLYYTGSGTGEGANAGGGVVEDIPDEVQRYGERDAQEGSATMGGDINQIRAGAIKKLNKLSDRRPGYTIVLTQGFWRGRSHIDIGDYIRLVLRLGKETLNEKYRVTEINVDIDENNHETVTLTLGKPQASADPRSRRSPILRLVRALKNYQIPDKALDVPPDDD